MVIEHDGKSPPIPSRTGAGRRGLSGRVLSTEEIHLGSRVIEAPGVYSSGPAIIENGKVIQPRHEIRVLGGHRRTSGGRRLRRRDCGAGGGASGAEGDAVERYGCFGGLWTAGLVLIVLATHVKTAAGLNKCVRGIGDELLERLLKIKGGIVNQAARKAKSDERSGGDQVCDGRDAAGSGHRDPAAQLGHGTPSCRAAR